MANPWFKFYGGEYLSDQKILRLTAAERSCWVTLLCYASQSNGVVQYLTESQLMAQAGIDFQEEEWRRTEGVLEKLQSLGMVSIREQKITVRNWKKRQETYLTNAERQARYRERHGNVTNKQQGSNTDVTEVTLDKNRKDKDKNKDTSEQGPLGKEINEIITLFEPVNPTFERFFSNKTQRSAVARLLKKFGKDKVTGMVSGLPDIISQKFAPKVTTPLELERDLGKLVAFYQQSSSTKPRGKAIV